MLSQRYLSMFANIPSDGLNPKNFTLTNGIPPIHDKSLPGNERRLLTGQKQGRAGNVIWFAPAGKWCAGDYRFIMQGVGAPETE